jgi:D-alanyl-D-alanine carboxypeptidase (penicillin-binding protein 5/6)
MMTTWIVLHKFPLVPSQTGICETVTASDVATYNQDIVEEQSVAKVVQGENICERTLLRGIFVHSAGNYAQLLAQFTGLSTPQFVALMNSTAVSLGMMDTHYVDETGISSGDVSTAHDQMILTDDLMTNEPIVQSVAALTRVWLPVAGVVGTYTPFLGQDGVVGVKSGYTIAAGGCDVMAIGAMLGTTKVMTYIVVLGQKSANALFLAGKSALTIFRTIRPSIARVHTSAGIEIAWIGATDDVVSPPISLTK